MLRALVTLAQYRMDNDHMDDGWGWVMVVMMVVALLVVVALVVWLVRTTAPGRASEAAPPVPETPQQILDRRFAAGELTPAEYEERRALLGGGQPG